MCAGIFMSALHMLSLVLVGCYKSTPYKYEEYNYPYSMLRRLEILELICHFQFLLNFIGKGQAYVPRAFVLELIPSQQSNKVIRSNTYPDLI